MRTTFKMCLYIDITAFTTLQVPIWSFVLLDRILQYRYLILEVYFRFKFKQCICLFVCVNHIYSIICTKHIMNKTMNSWRHLIAHFIGLTQSPEINRLRTFQTHIEYCAFLSKSRSLTIVFDCYLYLLYTIYIQSV